MEECCVRDLALELAVGRDRCGGLSASNYDVVLLEIAEEEGLGSMAVSEAMDELALREDVCLS